MVLMTDFFNRSQSSAAGKKVVSEFILLVLIISLFGCDNHSSSSKGGVSDTPPVFRGIDLAYAPSKDSITLQWENATDDKTPPEKIKYRVVYIDADEYAGDIEDVPPIEKPLINRNMYTIEGLIPDTTYYCLAFAEDTDGNVSELKKPIPITTMREDIEVSQTPKDLSQMNVITESIEDNEMTLSGDDASSLEVGDLIVFEEAGHMLKKIETHTTEGGDVRVEVSDATLADVVRSGQLQTYVSFSSFSEEAVPAETAGSGQPSRFIDDIVDIVGDGVDVVTDAVDSVTGFFDPEADINRNGETINFANGVDLKVNFGLDPGIVTDSTFIDNALYDLQLELFCDLTFDATLTAGGTGEIIDLGVLSGDPVEKILFEKSKAYKYVIGGVPVYQRAMLQLVAEIEALIGPGPSFDLIYQNSPDIELHYGFSWSAGDSANDDFGFRLMGEGVNHITDVGLVGADFNEDTWLVTPPDADALVILRVFPRVQTTFYESASMSISLQSNTESDLRFNSPFPGSSYPDSEFSTYQANMFNVSKELLLSMDVDLSVFGWIPVANYNISESGIIPKLPSNVYTLPIIRNFSCASDTVQAGDTIECSFTLDDEPCNAVQNANIVWFTDPLFSATQRYPNYLEDRTTAIFSFAEEGPKLVMVSVEGDGVLGETGKQYAVQEITVTPSIDDDGDGYSETEGDCDDSNPAITPDTIGYADRDGDGYPSGQGSNICDAVKRFGSNIDSFLLEDDLESTDIDCDDSNSEIHPKTEWYYDGDNDGYRVSFRFSIKNPAKKQQCTRPSDKYKLLSELVSNEYDCADTDPDRNPNTIWYKDADGDGYSAGTTLTQCFKPSWHVPESELLGPEIDCLDTDAAINPATTWYQDEDGDGYATSKTKVQCDRPEGYVLESELKGPEIDCMDMYETINPATVWYRDYDGDKYSNGKSTVSCQRPYPHFKKENELKGIEGDCDDDDPDIHPKTKWYKDADNDGFSNGITQIQCERSAGYKLLAELTAPFGDCDDTDPTVLGSIAWYKDTDNDGYSDGATVNQCARPVSYKRASELTATAGDCDDTNPGINPATTWYKDADNDGYSDGTTASQCARPVNYKLASELTATSGDCDDTDPAINPATTWYLDYDGDGYSDGTTVNQCVRPLDYKLASELTATSGDCNDNWADVNPTTVWYKDIDGDNCSDGTTMVQCAQPAGYVFPFPWVLTSGDCDDNNWQLNPNTEWYEDADGDRFWNPATYTQQCTSPGPNYHNIYEPYFRSSCGIWDDCDDNNAYIYPDLWYKDADNDGYSDYTSVCQCPQPVGYKHWDEFLAPFNSTDCDDADPNLYPETWYKDADNDGYSDGMIWVTCPRPTGYKLASELIATSGDCDDNNSSKPVPNGCP